jgi:hypothetical protein
MRRDRALNPLDTVAAENLDRLGAVIDARSSEPIVTRKFARMKTEDSVPYVSERPTVRMPRLSAP